MVSDKILAAGARHFINAALNVKPVIPRPISPFQPFYPETSGQPPARNSSASLPLLYLHIPFCETLCPYCSFNRYIYDEATAQRYFAALTAEVEDYAKAGYDFASIYIGGGTPTIQLDLLVALINRCKQLFSIEEVSCETNPNHLTNQYIEQLANRVQRLSVGIQSFYSDLLNQMGRLDKYGNAESILGGIELAAPHFVSLNADMMFNFPGQSADILQRDIDTVYNSAATQTTFYPLMAAPSVRAELAATLGDVNYSQERVFYDMICSGLTSGDRLFDYGSAWTFNRVHSVNSCQVNASRAIDEYVVTNDEYVACGAGGFGILNGTLSVNEFGIDKYCRRVSEVGNSVAFAKRFSKSQLANYARTMDAFGLRKYNTRHNQNRRYLAVVLMREFFTAVNKLRDIARA